MTSPSTPPRTLFVTVVAWCFIVFGTLGSLLSAAIAVAVFEDPWEALQADTLQWLLDLFFDKQPPSWLQWATAHMEQIAQALTLGALAGSVLMLVTSVGLLHRQRWSRLAFAAVTAGLCTVIGAATWLMFEVMRTFYTFGLKDASPDLQAQLDPMLANLGGGLVTIAVMVMLPLVLVAGRLLSARTTPEFTRSSSR